MYNNCLHILCNIILITSTKKKIIVTNLFEFIILLIIFNKIMVGGRVGRGESDMGNVSERGRERAVEKRRVESVSERESRRDGRCEG